MLTLSQTLQYYKRKDVQKLILEHAKNKEIGIKFGEGFGKRPDVLNYNNDVIEFAKNGATSFNCSEESWSNPLHLNPNLKKNELDELRIGWDLILDIDCPYWNFSKLVTYIFIKALKDHGVNCVTVKFSGNKGFHIGVPFEAFPDSIVKFDEKEGKAQQIGLKDWFPEGPRKIAEYLTSYASKNLIIIDKDKDAIKFGKINVDLKKLLAETGKTDNELTKTICDKCKNIVDMKKVSSKVEYVCPGCENRISDEDKKFQICPKCGKIMEKHYSNKALCSCGSNSTHKELDLSSIVNVDTVLISSRHMYRMPYSLHEKTGLVSVPFDIMHILKFDKKEAEQKTFKPHKFLNRDEAKPGEALVLFQKAFDYKSERLQKSREDTRTIFKKEKNIMQSQNLNIDNTAIPEDFFPPCIKKISLGLEDGKKRALLVLINFLSSCNWEPDKIEEYVMKWNERNKPDQLRETYIRGQLRYHKQQAANNKDKMMPPNCDNRAYMIDTQFCNPDGLCRNIKNPVQYAKKKVWMQNNSTPKKRVSKKEEKDE